LDSLEHITHLMGEHAEAVDYHRRAVECLAGFGNTYSP
jgi:hypothetical protein